MEDKLHPTVKEFKKFLSDHPSLVKEVRKQGRSWQEYYEKWVLLGEDDPLWEKYKKSDSNSDRKEGKTQKKQSELFGQIMKLTENIDLNKVQEQVTQLSSTISTVQELLEQFQDTKKSSPNHRPNNQPFKWFRD